MSDEINEKLRLIPSIDKLLDIPAIRDLTVQSSHSFVRDALRTVVDDLRKEMQSNSVSYNGEIAAEIQKRLQQRIHDARQSKLRPAINATGVVIHTNLGRAPLAVEAIKSMTEIAGRYSNLEYDLSTGRRGKRDAHCEELLCQLTGAESAVVVNNNAAGVFLTLNEVARDGEVIISRGELVEIGGGFRIPEVIGRSGAILREVGTTNKTRISDYESAINGNTKAILRVHPSNFRITGFTAKPSLEDLIELSNRTGIPCIEDNGSGCLVDPETMGLTDEPFVQVSIRSGAHVVTFSGDKLLGGPQSGIIVGKRELIDRIRRNPLMRAFRVDKLTYAGLEATLRLYVEGRESEIPVINMLRYDSQTLLERARRLINAVAQSLTDTGSGGAAQTGSITLSIGKSVSVVGGGSAPERQLRSYPIELLHRKISAREVEAWLRRQATPIITRIENDQVLIDLRTVTTDEESTVASALKSLSEIE
ncbi:MAG TPA: L-seryl-tRNA(Sec) selenium transferase [Blastocatellia bacterium]|nr:L-seryl-tRNA(Sec) selenium transferase [Blastocatellia bacterium]